MSTETESAQGGIVAVEVQVTPSKNYQSAGVRIRHEWLEPVEMPDIMQTLADLGGLAQEEAEQRVDQLVAQRDAETQGEVERQQKGRGGRPQTPRTPQSPRRSPSQQGDGLQDSAGDQDSPGVEWRQSARPNGKGTIRYRPTDNLSTDALKAMVTEAIAGSSADPSLHVVYDERIGDRGLESTGKGYGFASVKPSEDNPAYDLMLRDGRNGNRYPRPSFYVDFNDDGTVRVKPSDDYKKAAKQAKDAEEQRQQEPEEELPF